MNNIIQFKRQPVRLLPEVRDVFNQEAPADKIAAMKAAATEKPVHGGYPAAASDKLTVTVDAMNLVTARSVVMALQFYAKSGFDHGAMAKAALQEMVEALKANAAQEPQQ